MTYGQNLEPNPTGDKKYHQWLENDADPLIQKRVAGYQSKIDSGEIKLSEYADRRLAAHSEIVAYDERALELPVDENTISELYLHNIDLTKAYKTGDILPKYVVNTVVI